MADATHQFAGARPTTAPLLHARWKRLDSGPAHPTLLADRVPDASRWPCSIHASRRT